MYLIHQNNTSGAAMKREKQSPWAYFLDAAVVRRRLDEYVASTSENARYTDVFRWYILELWMRRMFGSQTS